jgi:hypothetical protein
MKLKLDLREDWAKLSNFKARKGGRERGRKKVVKHLGLLPSLSTMFPAHNS